MTTVAHRVSGMFSFAELGVAPDIVAIWSTRRQRRPGTTEADAKWRGGGGEEATRRVSLIDALATRLVVFGLWRLPQRGHVLIHLFRSAYHSPYRLCYHYTNVLPIIIRMATRVACPYHSCCMKLVVSNIATTDRMIGSCTSGAQWKLVTL